MAKIITRQYYIELEKLPAVFHGCRLLFLTDLHGCLHNTLLDQVKAEHPDYILIGGDMLVGHLEPEKQGKTGIKQAEALIAALAQDYPVYYVYGNHEGKTMPETLNAYRKRLEGAGVRFLDNESVTLERNGEQIMLHGLRLEQEWYPKGRRRQYPVEDIKAKLQCCPGEKPDGLCHILLAHHPNYFPAYAAWGADLVLAGHIHGGVVRLPWIGGVIGPDFLLFPPYSGGLYQMKMETGSEDGTVHNSQMIVSCGLGTHTIKFRMFNPPELTCVELRAQST